MDGGHPIFDGPFGNDDVRPSFVEIAGRHFEVEFVWEEITQRYNESQGWIAQTTVDGRLYRGGMATPMHSLMNLISELQRVFGFRQNRFTTDLPTSWQSMQYLMTSTSR